MRKLSQVLWLLSAMSGMTLAVARPARAADLPEGNHQRHWIDGHPTVDVIDLDEKGRKLKGVLGMQVHVGPPMTIQYRDIYLKKLPSDLPLVVPDKAPIPADARKVVPQGQDKPKTPDAE
jgi:hypothetical protein